MVDNTTLPQSDGLGDTFRNKDRTGVKTPISLLDVGGNSAEAIVGDAGVGMPCEGMAAENAAAVGSPILVGGRYDATPRTLGDGDAGALALDADGALHISDGGNTITVDGTVNAAQFGAWSVTIASGTISLPTGASTSAKQDLVITELQNIDAGKLEESTFTGRVGEVQATPTANTVLGRLKDIDDALGGTLTVNGSGVTQPVSAASLPLPTGAATAANQTTVIGHLDGVEGLLTTIDTDTSTIAAAVSGTEVQVDIVASLPAGTNNIGDVDVLTFPSTVHSADYDSGAGTDTTLAFGIVVPASGGAVVINGDATNGLDVDVTRVSGTVTVDGSGVTQPISAVSLPLPTGASTSAKQPALGTAGIASADVITVQGIASMTPILVNGSGVTQPVSGTVTAELSAVDNAVLDAIQAAVEGTLTVASHAVTNAGTFAVQESGGALTALQLIDNVIYVDDAGWTALTSSHALFGGVYQSTPGTITDGDTGPIRLTANGAAHVAIQNTVTVASHAVTNTGTFAVQAAQSGPWSITDISGTVSLPTGASTAANQSTANAALAGIQAAVELLDNAVSGTEIQVDVVAPLPAGANAIGKLAANSGVDIGDVDVTSLPSTVHSEDYDTGVGTDTTLAFGLAVPASGGAVVITGDAANGLDVDVTRVGGTVTVDGSAVTQPVSAASLPLPTGAATSANQSTANAALAAIQAATELIDNAISGSEMQVDIVAPLPTGTNTIGAVVNETVSTSTLSNVSGSATSVQLLASTAGRKGASFFNDSTAIAYLKLGTTASTSSFTVKMNPETFYELPQPVYTGRIDCIWSAANGSMRITELT